MLIETISQRYSIALAQADSLQSDFAQIISQLTEPLADGYYRVGSVDGILAQNRLEVTPYGFAGPGSNFSLRVYGWRFTGVRNRWIWVPRFLVELSCTTCDSPTPADGYPGVQNAPIPDSYNFCDTISLVQGDTNCVINSTGPGTNLIASAVIPLYGVQRISFDFQNADLATQVGMNALFCFC